MIFGYTIPEAKKAIVSAIVLALIVVGYFVSFDPSLQTAVPLLGSAVVGIVGVFLTKNHTPDDLAKAVQALIASLGGVVSIFVTVNPDLWQSITALVLLLVVHPAAVYEATNQVPKKHRTVH